MQEAAHVTIEATTLLGYFDPALTNPSVAKAKFLPEVQYLAAKAVLSYILCPLRRQLRGMLPYISLARWPKLMITST